MERLQPFRKNWREAVLVALLVLNLLTWFSLGFRNKKSPLTVYFLDVGQGDAILVESPMGNRVLIDGGRNRQVVSELGRALSFGERDIEVVIATHPDADHIGGLPEVFKRYAVSLFIKPELEEESDLNQELDKRVKDEGSDLLYAKRGQVLDLGGGTRLSILFPDRDVSNWESNDASVVARLDYGESSFIFTGDAGIKTENILLSLNPKVLDGDVLKVGHHGSRTSTSLRFAETLTPEISVISAGKNNSYGHPHKEVIDILEKVGSQIKNTALSGTLKFETEGKEIRVK